MDVHYHGDDGWNLIRAAQAALVDENIGTVSTVDCPLDDRIHLSLKGQHTVGKRLAIAAQAAINNQAHVASPQIVQESIVFEKPRVSESTMAFALKLLFKNLHNNGGSFQDVDTPQGFSLRDVNGLDI